MLSKFHRIPYSWIKNTPHPHPNWNFSWEDLGTSVLTLPRVPYLDQFLAVLLPTFTTGLILGRWSKQPLISTEPAHYHLYKNVQTPCLRRHILFYTKCFHVKGSICFVAYLRVLSGAPRPANDATNINVLVTHTAAILLIYGHKKCDIEVHSTRTTALLKKDRDSRTVHCPHLKGEGTSQTIIQQWTS